MEKSEIIASFSYKISLGNYEMAEFYACQKKEVVKGEEETEYKKLYDFVKKQVLKEAIRFRTQVQQPIAMAEASIVENPMPSVEEWEAMSPEEKWLRLELNRAKKRVDYHQNKQKQ